MWVGDYTIQPENGGLSVFAHEYAHDLGLPDLYDTSGNTGGAENSTRWWSLMSQSRGTNPGDPGIGDRPMPLGAWDKFQLGWLDDAIVKPGKSKTVKLRPGQTKGAKPNGIVVLLPDKKIRQNLGAPCAEDCGERYFYSDKGNDLDNNMKRAVDRWRSAHRQGEVRDRGRLGLRVPRGVERQRCHLDADRHLGELRR